MEPADLTYDHSRSVADMRRTAEHLPPELMPHHHHDDGQADHHHLSAHNRSDDDIDNAQAEPDDDSRAANHLTIDDRALVDNLVYSAFTKLHLFRDVRALNIHHDGCDIDLYRQSLGFARTDIDRAIAIIDGQRQPENDPRIGDDRGVVE